MIYLGIDNGITGSLGILWPDNMIIYKKIPTFKQLNYTKSKQWITRIDGFRLTAFLYDVAKEDCFCMIERPFTGKFWKSAVSAARCCEATLIILETLKIPYQFIDSGEWQKVLLPKKLEGDELKRASLSVGRRLFPHMTFDGFKDADGILIAEYCRRIKGGRK